MTSLHSKRQVRATTRGGPLPSFAALHSQVGLGSHEARLPTVRLSGRQPGPDPASVPARERADPPAGREGDLLLLDDLTEPPAVAMSEADKYRVLNQDTGQATLPYIPCPAIPCPTFIGCNGHVPYAGEVLDIRDTARLLALTSPQKPSGQVTRRSLLCCSVTHNR